MRPESAPVRVAVSLRQVLNGLVCQVTCKGRPQVIESEGVLMTANIRYLKKVLFGRIRGKTVKIIRQLCRQKEVELINGKRWPPLVGQVGGGNKVDSRYGYAASKRNRPA